MGERDLDRGLWGILATPFRGPELAFDAESMRRQLARHREVGSKGVVALGVFGEAARLTPDERSRVAAVVAEAAQLPVVLGLPELDTADVISSARALSEAAGGALRALMVQINTPDAEQLRRHLTAVYDALGVPLVVQDYPVASGVDISSADVVTALRGLEFIAAIKSEAPPTPVAIAELSAELDVPVFGGLGGIGLLDELLAGAAGAMTGFSVPDVLVRTVDAYFNGGFDAARIGYQPWLPLVNFEAQAGVGLAIRKRSLYEQGVLADAAVRPPARPLPTSLLPLLRRHLDGVGLTVSTPNAEVPVQ